MSLRKSTEPPKRWTYVPRKITNIPRLDPELIKQRLQARSQELMEESLLSESENEDVFKEQKECVVKEKETHKRKLEENNSHADEHAIKIIDQFSNHLCSQTTNQQNPKSPLETVFEETTLLNESFVENTQSFRAENKENNCSQNLEPLNLSRDFVANKKYEHWTQNHKKNDSYNVCDGFIKNPEKNDSFDLDFSALSIRTPVKKKAHAILPPKINIIPLTPKNEIVYDNRLQTPLPNNLGANMMQNAYSVSKQFKTPQNKPKMMPSYSAKKLPTPFQNGGFKITPMHCKTLPETACNERTYESVARSCNFREDEFSRILVNGVEYLVMNILGKGGSSEVFHCFNPESRQHVAIKCVSLSNPETATGYINEVKLLESLQRCDRIIKMHSYEIREEEEKLLVVLEKGSEDLSAILKQLASKQGHLPMYMVLFYWMEMLYAVQQIHMNGVIHSDLKPANFLRAESGLKLIDFGIASRVQEDMTCVYKSYQEGSSNYISPEAVVTQNTGQANSPSFGTPRYKVHYKSDVWSLGCILYQLVYRNTPFQHINPLWAKFSAITNPNHKIEYPASNWVSPRITNTIKKCLQYDIKARPSVTDLIKEYEALLNHI